MEQQEPQEQPYDTERETVHAYSCPFFLHGGVCNCGVIDPDMFEFALVHDAVLVEEDDDE